MNVEHPDITRAMQTGYERGKAPPVVTVWQAQEVRHEDAFPYYVSTDEREDD